MAKAFKSWSDLQEQPVDKLMDLFDQQHNIQGTIGREFIRDEIYHRRASEQFEQMHRLTKTMTSLTRWIFGFTVVNVVAFVIQIIR